jgi:hypothetical protein
MRKNLNYAKYAFCALPLLIGTSINVGAEPSTDATDATARISKSDDLGIKAFEAAVFADTRKASEPDKKVKVVQITVRGKVTDENGQGLPGVTVLVENNSQGTITDLNGNFTIEVPHENVTLLFSFIGYTAQSIPLNGRTSLYTTFNTITFDEPASLEPVDEVEGVSTNNTAQWSLNAIQLLELAGDQFPDNHPRFKNSQ